MYNYKAIVLRVIDADTIDVNVDLGFDTWRKERVRLAGIDAPEMNTTAGRAAALFVSLVLPDNFAVQIHTEKPYPHDKYGRYLAVIALPDGRVLNDMLIESGHAVAYDGKARGG